MKKEELFKAFTAMSPEDQDAIRAEVMGKGASKESEEHCGPGMMKEHMKGMMMKMMEGADNPMAMCEEMKQMCEEKMRTMDKEKCCG